VLEVVLPDSQNAVAIGAQSTVYQLVAGSIGSDLFPPERLVCRGPVVAFGASVPIATVDKDQQLMAQKSKSLDS
jgi:hypothetical protein